MSKKPPITISQSVIKMFMHNFNELEDDFICPRKIYCQTVLRMRTQSTLNNLRGLYFEDVACGTNKNEISLPGDARSGKKTMITRRIESQAHIFQEWIRERDGLVTSENTKIKIYKRWEHDPNVILSGELDIFPVALLNSDPDGPRYILSIIDLKLSQNLKSDFGKFGWGNISRMDHTQAIMYLYLVRNIDYELNDQINPDNNLRELTSEIKDVLDAGLCQFRYYVADLQANYTSDVFIYELKPDDFKQLHEAVRKVVWRLREFNNAEWPVNPSSDLCLGNAVQNVYPCPFINCSKRKKEKTI